MGNRWRGPARRARQSGSRAVVDVLQQTKMVSSNVHVRRGRFWSDPRSLRSCHLLDLLLTARGLGVLLRRRVDHCLEAANGRVVPRVLHRDGGVLHRRGRLAQGQRTSASLSGSVPAAFSMACMTGGPAHRSALVLAVVFILVFIAYVRSGDRIVLGMGRIADRPRLTNGVSTP